jgi:hypothetical protein
MHPSGFFDAWVQEALTHAFLDPVAVQHLALEAGRFPNFLGTANKLRRPLPFKQPPDLPPATMQNAPSILHVSQGAT